MHTFVDLVFAALMVSALLIVVAVGISIVMDCSKKQCDVCDGRAIYKTKREGKLIGYWCFKHLPGVDNNGCKTTRL